MKKIRWIILIIIISNFIPHLGIQVFHFQTPNKEYQFSYVPAKGHEIHSMEDSFRKFKKSSTEYQDLKLYRTFEKKPYKFWYWKDYLFAPEWQYPYCESCEI